MARCDARLLNLPERTRAAFTDDGWYRTGDVGFEDADGALVVVGRRDRMVKLRGYRVELGEIEAALYRHEALEEVAVLALPEGDGLVIKAFLACGGSAPPSVLALKQHCARNLPAYMIPDRFEVLDVLPKTSTDKIDYQRLKTRG
ncbi:MAG: AMP-binding protein [Nannocystaceae bacterium]